MTVKWYVAFGEGTQDAVDVLTLPETFCAELPGNPLPQCNNAGEWRNETISAAWAVAGCSLSAFFRRGRHPITEQMVRDWIALNDRAQRVPVYGLSFDGESARRGKTFIAYCAFWIEWSHKNCTNPLFVYY